MVLWLWEVLGCGLNLGVGLFRFYLLTPWRVEVDGAHLAALRFPKLMQFPRYRMRDTLRIFPCIYLSEADHDKHM